MILASGLDSRAYRLDWPAGTTVYEIDQPKVLEYKSATLAENGVTPNGRSPRGADRSAPRLARGADAPQGSTRGSRTAWLAEGLLMYLPADAQDRLFAQITELSRGGQPDRRRNRGHARRGAARADAGAVREGGRASSAWSETLDVGELMYDDPDRADVAAWLDDHGWLAHAQPVTGRDAPAGPLGRECPVADDKDAFSDFVTAERV